MCSLIIKTIETKCKGPDLNLNGWLPDSSVLEFVVESVDRESSSCSLLDTIMVWLVETESVNKIFHIIGFFLLTERPE